MLRSVLVAIFPAAMLASGVIANAQSTVAWNGAASSGSWNGPRIHQSSPQQQTTLHATKHASNFGSNAQHNGNKNHGAQPPKHPHHRNANVPWWSRSVIINAGTASNYLPTPTPKPKPKNNVTRPGVEVFKSIGN